LVTGSTLVVLAQHRVQILDAGQLIPQLGRADPAGSAVFDMLALGAEVEVLQPPELRAQVRQVAIRLADLHRDDDGGPDQPGQR
jgi:hypothetical protein